jgi:hypothetical protein
VRPVAKWFILRPAATANGNNRAALQAVFIALHIHYFKITFYSNRTVIVYGKPCFAHIYVFREGKNPLPTIRKDLTTFEKLPNLPVNSYLTRVR